MKLNALLEKHEKNGLEEDGGFGCQFCRFLSIKGGVVMKKNALKGLRILSSSLIIISVLLCVLLVGVKALGFKVYTVLSPSMEPQYPTGSVIYVKTIKSEELKVGDVITFKLTQQITATHRIIEIVPNEKNKDFIYFRTKGDANKTADASLVAETDIIGKPVFKIRYLGFIANFIQRPAGRCVTVAFALILIILVYITEAFANEKSSVLREEKI